MDTLSSTTRTSCLNCEKDLGFGRPDRKFCGDACRHDHHNKEKSVDHAETKRVHAILKKNHKILKRMLGYEKGIIISRDELLRAGYNFLYHTRTHQTSQGFYEYCYNYGFRHEKDDKYLVLMSALD